MKALALAAAAVPKCLKDRAAAPARRRARGRGVVAGPVALAAQAQRIPLALMEADAHLGLANRLAAPFAERVFLSFPVEGRDGGKYRVVGRPIPARSRPVPRTRRVRGSGFRPRGPWWVVFGGSQVRVR